MTASGRPGRPVVLNVDMTEHVFARSGDDQLLHVRFDELHSLGFKLGGQLAGDPTAVLVQGLPHVFARCVGGRLLHWLQEPGRTELTGPVDHGWWAAYDPVAVTNVNDEIAIFARSANDELVRWGLSAQGEPSQATSLGGSVVSTPAVLGTLGTDVFTRAADGSIDWNGRYGWKRIGGGTAAGPVAVSWSPDRLDVLALGAESTGPRLLHWGYTFGKGWFGPDVSDLGSTERLACAAATEKDHARLFARDGNGHLQSWHWDGGFIPDSTGWFGPELVSDRVLASPPGARPGTSTVLAWVGDGTTLFRFTKEPSGWLAAEMEIEWATPSPDSALEVPVEVDLLFSRPVDLLRLGVSWSGFDVADGDPPTLVPAGGGPPTLRLVLPPQHVADEALPDGREFTPESTLAAVKAGPSRLVFDVASEPIPLTTAGVLAAARKAPLRGRDEATGELETFLELPWQLFVAPNGARVMHPLDAAAATDLVALWRTNLRSDSGELAILRAGGEDDGITPALSGPLRQALAAQSAPARFERLELSSLGGTLRASGDWDGLKWQHDATLGRDNRVRVDMSGLLYPYGFPAVFTTITERRLTDDLPVGVLRQRAFITVLGPMPAPADDEHARAFPFDEVTITTPVFENVTADWQMGSRPGYPPVQPLSELESAREELGQLPRVVDGWSGPPPLDEVEARLIGGGQPELARRRFELIEKVQWLEQHAEALQEIETAAMPLFFCPRVGGAWVEFPVTGRLGDQTVSFATPMLFAVDEQLPETPLRPAYDTLTDDNVQARLAEEWAKIRSGASAESPPPPGDTVLRDREYAGAVMLSGRSLDLFRLDEGGELPVHRIYVSAEPLGRGFRPQLGPATAVPGGVTQPAWGIDVELPSLRQLLPGRPEAHRALTAFSRDYLESGASADVVQDLVGPAEGIVGEDGGLVDAAGVPIEEVRGIVVDFTRSSERSGGLVAPKVAADGLSRTAGPVNVDGLESLDPAKLFDTAATLLGFPLAELLGPLTREQIPAIATVLSGPQPVAMLAWPPYPPGTPPDQRPRQELTASAPFGPVDGRPKPTLALEVRTAGADVRTECTVRDFSLSFPADDPLLRLTFREVRYVQEAGKPPALAIEGLDASFLGDLDLLATLQDKIGLAGASPTVRAEGSAVVASYSLAVPDAAAGAFVMRNLRFDASITVPFQGDPVVVALGFASRAMPFSLSVMMFGGGGYVDVELDHAGLRRLEIVLEFGASVGVDFVIAQGEAHVLGGIRYELLPSGAAQVVGFLRVGGSLEVLGLVSVSVELVLSLGYETTGNRLVGRATLVIELDLTLFSDSVELDSGEWVISGGDPAERIQDQLPKPPGDPYLDLFREHRDAFRAVPDA
jgi:hypothetical protein